MAGDSQLSLALELLLVQLVHKNGEHEANFEHTAKEFNVHPLKRKLDPNTEYTATDLNSFYQSLLEKYDINPDTYTKDLKHKPWITKLANILYEQFRQQLTEQIAQDESEFVQLVDSITK